MRKPKTAPAEKTERQLLDACFYFLNMLPNESHPNNPHGYRTSYDLAHALTLHYKAHPTPPLILTRETLGQVLDLYTAGYNDETILEVMNKAPAP